MRTRLSICRKKRRYATEQEAREAVLGATVTLRHYRCDRCSAYHLTSRTKGKRVPRPVPEAAQPEAQEAGLGAAATKPGN